jgi:hypothetical protein
VLLVSFEVSVWLASLLFWVSEEALSFDGFSVDMRDLRRLNDGRGIWLAGKAEVEDDAVADVDDVGGATDDDDDGDDGDGNHCDSNRDECGERGSVIDDWDEDGSAGKDGANKEVDEEDEDVPAGLLAFADGLDGVKKEDDAVD